MAHPNFGYPEGTKITDFVPAEILPLVHDHWYQFPPVNPMWHFLLGCVYIVLGFWSILGNGVVVYLFFKSDTLKTPSNFLVVNLALSDLIMLLTNFPFFAYNCFSGGVWMFSAFYCELYAALGAVTGVCSIWTLAMISADRYNVICNGFNGPKLTKGKAGVMSLTAWGMAIGWAIPPFVGWGKYIPEGILDSCSYDYLTLDTNTKSYNMCIFAFDFFVPLLIIVGAYTFIVKAICAHEAAMRKQAEKMNVKSLRSGEQNDESAEIRIAKTAIFNITLWLSCWTPYALVTLMGVLGKHDNITPLMTMLPALLAKSASCYNPFVYAVGHPKFRQAITIHMPWFCIHEEAPKKPAPADNKSDADNSTTAGDTAEKA